jgi:hypothetical protein
MIDNPNQPAHLIGRPQRKFLSEPVSNKLRKTMAIIRKSVAVSSRLTFLVTPGILRRIGPLDPLNGDVLAL